MLDTFSQSEIISYVVENNYHCTIDDVSESKIECDCTLKRCNEMVKGSMPPLFNCFKQCPRIFAITNISKDEEITIDYGYEDVGEKCLRGTTSCRCKIGYFSGENLGVIDETWNTGRLKGGETNDNCTTSNSHRVNNNLLLQEAIKDVNQ
uniref:SET domain-containing protein n=1 Tax=Strongyloides papillosus TaxID=174720 RepID=A0A0N5CAF8_STREA